LVAGNEQMPSDGCSDVAGADEADFHWLIPPCRFVVRRAAARFATGGVVDN
jgi:hypothetical protein